MIGKILTFNKVDGDNFYGLIEPEDVAQKSLRITYNNRSLKNKEVTTFMPGDKVFFYLQEGKTHAQGMNLASCADNDALTEHELRLGEHIMKVNRYLTITQMLYPDRLDHIGYSNSRYRTGFWLMQMWDDKNCEALRPAIIRRAAGLIKNHKDQVLDSDTKKEGIPPELIIKQSDLERFTTIKRNFVFDKHKHITKEKDMYINVDRVHGKLTGLTLVCTNKNYKNLFAKHQLIQSKEQVTETSNGINIKFNIDYAYKLIDFYRVYHYFFPKQISIDELIDSDAFPRAR